ncbi:MAG TPA: hypothetical protein VFE06_19195 [Acidobacteriaceae bacterium]|jgi:hypothetical protein|nr:hypothetical protein [Acidobacteriaceae bacterium]
MRVFCAGIAAAMLMGAAGGYCETSGSCARALEAPLHDRATLVIDSRPAGITITGTESDTLRITCTTPHDPHEIRLHLSGEGGHERLTISSDTEHEGSLQISIEVPRQTNLRVHLPAGEVKVNDIRGDKDIDLYAGQITIATGDTSDYRSVNASVDIGAVKAWGVDKGGFFRSVTRTTADGEYHLYAHVLTGEIDLQ